MTSDERGGDMPMYGKWVCLWPYMGTPQRRGFLGGLKLITFYYSNYKQIIDIPTVIFSVDDQAIEFIRSENTSTSKFLILQIQIETTLLQKCQTPLLL